jgi:hypothetical protein
MTRKQETDGSAFQPDLRGYFVIVGVVPGVSTVTVTPTASTLGGGGLPALEAGVSTEFSLAQGEVLSFESGGVGDDLTGSLVESSKPVAVFSGHVAASTATDCCADHLEQQIPPIHTWGKEYLVARSVERGNEPDYIRIVAATDGTQVMSKAGTEAPVTTWLNAGQFSEFPTFGHVTLTANHPVMVGQFLASSFESEHCNKNSDCQSGYVCSSAMPPFQPKKQCQYASFFCMSDSACGNGHVCYNGGCAPVGDPAMILAVPRTQWQSKYVFLTPDSYSEDYLNIIVAVGSTVTLDGSTLPASEFETIPGTNYAVIRKAVQDGAHQISANQPMSISVYGYDKDVSYGYPGGLGLHKP